MQLTLAATFGPMHACSLLAAACSVVTAAPSDVARAFGRHFVKEAAASQGCGGLLAGLGRSLPDFMAKLSALSAQLGGGIPLFMPCNIHVEKVCGSDERGRYAGSPNLHNPVLSTLLLNCSAASIPASRALPHCSHPSPADARVSCSRYVAY